jgi:lipopolysaccharide transport system permease protein
MVVDRASTRRQVRDFVWTLIRTDFKARYHGELSGFVWAMLKPLLMFLVLLAVFSFIFRDATYRFNLLIGLLLWDFFAEGTKSGIQSLLSKGFLLSKARFPRWILVVTSVANALFTMMVYSVSIVIVLAASRIGLWAPGVLLFLWYLVQYFLIVVGIGLASSVLLLKYRDLDQVWDVLLQAGFFLTPIFYPLRILPERYHIFLYAWPVTPVVQFSRDVLVEHHVPTLKAHALLLLVTLTVLAAGVALFRRYAGRAVEQL